MNISKGQVAFIVANRDMRPDDLARSLGMDISDVYAYMRGSEIIPKRHLHMDDYEKEIIRLLYDVVKIDVLVEILGRNKHTIRGYAQKHGYDKVEKDFILKLARFANEEIEAKEGV